MTVIPFESPTMHRIKKFKLEKRHEQAVNDAPVSERGFWRAYFGVERSREVLRDKHGQIIMAIWRSAVDDLGAEEAAKLFREFVK